MDEDHKKKDPAELPGSPRRASPRYAVKRRIELRCESWPAYRKVFTENIGRRGLLVYIATDPPEVGEFVMVRLRSLDGASAEIGGEVIRVDKDAGLPGRIGVAIKLDELEAEAMDSFIPTPSVPSPAPKRRRSSRWTRSRPPVSEPEGEDHRKDREVEGSEDVVDIDVAAEPAGAGTEDSESKTSEPSPDQPLEQSAEDLKTLADDLSMLLDASLATPEGDPEHRTDGAQAQSAPVAPAASQDPVRAIPVIGLGPPEQATGAAASPTATAPQPTAAPGADKGAFHQIGSRSGWGTTKQRVRQPRGEAPVVGMDFGTTYSKVAVFDGREVVLVEDTASAASSRSAIPSAVAYLSDGSCLVGEPAREMLATEPAQVVTSVKRVMGLSFSDPLANGLLGSLACPSHSGPNDSILFDIHGREVTVPEVCSQVLSHMRALVSDMVGAKVKRAVLTVPVDFDTRARRELEIAARMAGLEVLAMVPEPVAAAIGCGHDGSDQDTIAIYDFGGGTFDASVVEVGQQRFEVRGASGDRWLGGDDFDEMLARHVADEFNKQTGISLHNRVEEWQRLIFACEEAKRWLSTLESVDVVLPRAAHTREGVHTLLVPVTRELFEDLTEDITTSSLEICRAATFQAGLRPRDVGSLLVTGGTSRIPSVRHAAERFFGKRALAGVHPEHAVVIGAAVRAAVLSKVEMPEDLVKRLRGYGTLGRNIGIALAGGTTEHIITGDQRPPTAAVRRYSTSRDGQTTIRIELVEGDSLHTAANRRIGGFVIQDLPARQAGTLSLDVYFELSSTGTLYVTAQERSTGQRAQGTFDLNLG